MKLPPKRPLGLNPKIPIDDPFQARIAAQAIVYHGFDLKLAVADLRPGLKSWRYFGAKLMAEPAVRREIEIIMDRTENDSKKFLNLMWEWLEPKPSNASIAIIDKAQTERQLTAARILAKGYIGEKKGPEEQVRKPMVIEGLGDGIQNLTGESPVVEELDPKKVM